jgi:hypothetical protein
MSSRPRSVADVISTRRLYAIVREILVETVPQRFATTWQEQHPQEAMPVDAATPLDVLVDVAVVNAFVDDITSTLVRRLETVEAT